MKKYILLLAITLVSVHTWAQENRTKTLINAALHGWEYELKAGFNIGGTLPLGGRVEVESEEGCFSEFTLYFPIETV